MSEFDAALEAINVAQDRFLTAAKEELTDALSEVFVNPLVKTVGWSQKYSEYNDEGLYPGVMGPVLNQFMIAGAEGGDIELDFGDYWEALYDRSGKNGSSLLSRLKRSLNLIGEETLCKIIGDDEHIVVAYRVDEKGAYKIEAESARW